MIKRDYWTFDQIEKANDFISGVLTVFIALLLLATICRSTGLFDCFVFLPELFDPRNWGE